MNQRDLEQQIPGWGADALQANRPGVPMEKTPSDALGAHWTEPERQTPRSDITHRMEIPQLMPVYSGQVPPKGLSGVLRRFAYSIPEHRARHWALLLLADRVDVLESKLPDAKVIAVAAGVAGVGALFAARGLRRLNA